MRVMIQQPEVQRNVWRSDVQQRRGPITEQILLYLRGNLKINIQMQRFRLR